MWNRRQILFSLLSPLLGTSIASGQEEKKTALVLTLETENKSLDVNLGRICRSNSNLLAYTAANGLFIIKPADPTSARMATETLMERVANARFPSVEGMPCRVAGMLTGIYQGVPVALAMIERGTPPNSEIGIVRLGEKVMLGKQQGTISQIDTKGVLLQIEERQVGVPLAPIVPKSTNYR